VVGVDRPAVLRTARSRGAVDETTTSLVRGLREADLVVLALPVDSILEILPRVARHLAPGAIVTDVGSTKEAIDDAARRQGLVGRFVGGHPMAGSERSGIEHADGGLFEGAPWVLCPTKGAGAASGRVASLVRRLGADPALLDPRAHDRVMARLSHLPQLVSVALTNTAGAREARPFLHLAGPGLRQMSRLADSPPGLWDAILKTNRSAARRALDDFTREVRRLRASLRTGPSALFRRAARVRARLLSGKRDGAALW
jgi:prephenate dehydrogenase